MERFCKMIDDKLNAHEQRINTKLEAFESKFESKVIEIEKNVSELENRTNNVAKCFEEVTIGQMIPALQEMIQQFLRLAGHLGKLQKDLKNLELDVDDLYNEEEEQNEEDQEND